MEPQVSPFPSLYQSNLFTLVLDQQEDKTKITMKIHDSLVNTRELPGTLAILEENLPSIFRTTCFNDDHVSFLKEVRHTEVGHLFEHIILAYLCENTVVEKNCSITYKGETSWNWLKDDFGTYHITLNVGKKDANVFFSSLEKSIILLDTIMREGKQKEVNINSSFMFRQFEENYHTPPAHPLF
ncbi:MAG: cyanophycin synthetase family protein [Patescibacteria group bacterium]|jgi:hypothetical protein